MSFSDGIEKDFKGVCIVYVYGLEVFINIAPFKFKNNTLRIKLSRGGKISLLPKIYICRLFYCPHFLSFYFHAFFFSLYPILWQTRDACATFFSLFIIALPLHTLCGDERARGREALLKFLLYILDNALALRSRN